MQALEGNRPGLPPVPAPPPASGVLPACEPLGPHLQARCHQHRRGLVYMVPSAELSTGQELS